MDKIKNNYKIILCIILFLILFMVYGYFRIFKSYGYVSNTELIRTVVKNTAGFYYDRGGYIQFDSSFMDENNTVKRSESFSFIDANRDGIKYTDQVGFIYNVFKWGIDLDISLLIDDLSFENIYNFGKEIYGKISDNDERKNVKFNDGEYTLDYYDNYVTRLSGTMGGNEEKHYLIMYVKNDGLMDRDKEGIFNKLKETLCVGDVIVFNNQILLYVGNNMLMYANGEDYDYINGIEYVEDKAIKVIGVDEINEIDNEMYLFSGLEFYVYRFLNVSGYWSKLPASFQALKSYYNNESIPNIKIEKFGSKYNDNDVYVDDEITITIKITNNSNNKVVIPLITDEIDTSRLEYISNTYINEAYLDGKFTFTDVQIEGNSYKEISYLVKVKANDGEINFDQTKIGNYVINSINYKVSKKVDFTRLINGTDDIFTNYKKLYNISLVKDKDNDINKEIIVNKLYGGVRGKYNDRAKYISKKSLLTGDIILYDDEIAMYVNENDDEYLVNYNNQRISDDVDKFLNKLLSKQEFIIIRPSYLYDENIIKFGELVVDHDEKIIYIDTICVYRDIILQFSDDMLITVVDINNNEIGIDENVKTGSKIIVSEEEYYISLLGDVNGDGLINTGDVLKLHRYVLGKIEKLEKYYLASSYINQDGVINTGDVLKLHRYVLGKIETLE